MRSPKSEPTTVCDTGFADFLERQVSNAQVTEEVEVREEVEVKEEHEDHLMQTKQANMPFMAGAQVVLNLPSGQDYGVPPPQQNYGALPPPQDSGHLAERVPRALPDAMSQALDRMGTQARMKRIMPTIDITRFPFTTIKEKVKPLRFMGDFRYDMGRLGFFKHFEYRNDGKIGPWRYRSNQGCDFGFCWTELSTKDTCPFGAGCDWRHCPPSKLGRRFMAQVGAWDVIGIMIRSYVFKYAGAGSDITLSPFRRPSRPPADHDVPWIQCAIPDNWEDMQPAIVREVFRRWDILCAQQTEKEKVIDAKGDAAVEVMDDVAEEVDKAIDAKGDAAVEVMGNNVKNVMHEEAVHEDVAHRDVENVEKVMDEEEAMDEGIYRPNSPSDDLMVD